MDKERVKLTRKSEVGRVVDRARVILHHEIVLSIAGDIRNRTVNEKAQWRLLLGLWGITHRDIEYSVPFCSTDGQTAVPQSASSPAPVLLSAVPVHIVNEGETTLSGEVLCERVSTLTSVVGYEPHQTAWSVSPGT
jgi:hypothetical protein